MCADPGMAGVAGVGVTELGLTAPRNRVGSRVTRGEFDAWAVHWFAHWINETLGMIARILACLSA